MSFVRTEELVNPMNVDKPHLFDKLGSYQYRRNTTQSYLSSRGQRRRATKNASACNL